MGTKLFLKCFVLVLLVWATSAACPANCTCDTAPITIYKCIGLTEVELKATLNQIDASVKTLSFTGYTVPNIKKDTFLKATNVTALTIEGTKVTTIDEGAFNGLSALTSLTISNTSIVSLGNKMFEPLKAKLKILELDMNKLTTLSDDVFKGMTLLTNLTLDSNKFTNIPKDVLQKLPVAAAVSLEGNPYDCSCSDTNKEMWKLLKTNYTKVSIICSTPTTLKGDKLKDMKEEKLCPPTSTAPPNATTTDSMPTTTAESKMIGLLPDWAFVIILAGIVAIILIVIGICCQKNKRKEEARQKQYEAERTAQPQEYTNQGYIS